MIQLQLGFKRNVLRIAAWLLIGHVLTELSRPVTDFLGTSKMNSLFVQVCGKRKSEVGLNVPGLYQGRMKKSKFGNILAKKIKKITERYPIDFDFSLEQGIIS